jgi:hypothetical protein
MFGAIAFGAYYSFTVNIHLQGPNTTDRTTDNTCLLIETKPERGASASSSHRLPGRRSLGAGDGDGNRWHLFSSLDVCFVF